MPRRSTNPVGTLAKASMGIITRLERRNRELLAALAPFAAMHPLTEHTDLRDGQVVMRLCEGADRRELLKVHFRTAAKLVNNA